MIDIDDKFRHLFTAFAPGAEVLSARVLEGGISAEVTAIDYRSSNGVISRAVLRQHGEDQLEWTPDNAAIEFRLLKLLERTNVPAPKPLHLDTSCTEFSAPVLVLEYIEGETLYEPQDPLRCLHQHAEALTTINAITTKTHDLSFLPAQRERNEAWLADRDHPPDETLQEPLILEVLNANWPLPQNNALTLLHGDYWPGNVLFKDGAITAIIDWEDVMLGDPIEDLAIARMEVMWMFGAEAMEAFTARYVDLRPGMDVSALPLWDLNAALRPTGQLSRWAMEDSRKETIRKGHEVFVKQAVEKLRSTNSAL